MRPTWDEFLELVEKHFAYLTSEYGFKRTRTEPYIVEYSSEMWCISLFWGSFMMELDLGVKAHDGSIDTSLATIAFIYGKEDRDYSEKWYHVETVEKVNAGLAFYSSKLMSDGKDILIGNKDYIRKTSRLLSKTISKMYPKHPKYPSQK